MSSLSGEENFLLLVLCFLVCIMLSQWKFLKCLSCKAITIISNSSAPPPPPLNSIQWQFQDYSIPQNSSPQFQGSDLELSILNSLPIYQFMKSGTPEKTINVDCSICLGEFEEEEWLKLLPSCNHGFHVSCIDKWFQLHSSCPLCRSRVHRVQVVSSESSVSFRTWIEILGMDDITPERNAHFPSHSL